MTLSEETAAELRELAADTVRWSSHWDDVRVAPSVIIRWWQDLGIRLVRELDR